MSKTIKKAKGEQGFQQRMAKNVGKVVKLFDKEAKIAEMAYYTVQTRKGHELEDWSDAE